MHVWEEWELCPCVMMIGREKGQPVRLRLQAAMSGISCLGVKRTANVPIDPFVVCSDNNLAGPKVLGVRYQLRQQRILSSSTPK